MNGDIPDCAYCTARAVGVDDEQEPTCGDCSTPVGPLPDVIEASADDEDSE